MDFSAVQFAKVAACPFMRRSTWEQIKMEVKTSNIAHIVLKAGEFADKGISLQQKIDKNIEFGIKMGMTKEEAKNMAEGLLPNLERWKN